MTVRLAAMFVLTAPLLAAGAETPTPPTLRLGDAARPVRYDATLAVSPTEETFTGTIDIEIATREAAAVLWLNAEELTITAAHATSGGRRIAVEPLTTPRDFLGLRFTPPLPAGPSQLHIEYTGRTSPKESSGLFRRKDGDDWYLYSHFEPIDARRVFPCFDEPSFKARWRLTLRVPTGTRAFANAPMLSETEAGDGTKAVAFAESKPLPSYAVAMAVGPFETVDAGRSRKGHPLRIIVPRGSSSRAAWYAKNVATLLGRLEDYFGSDYPYEKLDSLAMPQVSFAMENPGLVTFPTLSMLRRPEDETVAWHRAEARLIFHEFAHLWFGDSVTTTWWDDLWLNEAFADWMATRANEEWQPGWGIGEDRVTGTRSTAMGADSLMTARKIRQPVVANDDMKNAFDAITYSKGQLVLHMLESWIGPEVMQRGVRRYLSEHAHGNAVSADFFDAISKAAGRDVSPMLSTWLDQPGVPLVTVGLECTGSREPAVTLAQERFLPEGSTGAAEAAAALWQIPICVRWGQGGRTGRACTVLTERKGRLALPGVRGCPDWLVPNDKAAGYYRAHLPADYVSRLLRDAQPAPSVAERLVVLADLSGLARAGRLSLAEILGLVPHLTKDDNPRIVQRAAIATAGLRDGQLIRLDQAPVLARFIQDHFGARARALGWQSQADEEDETRRLRLTLVPLVADEGEDEALAAEARRRADAWLTDSRAIDADLVSSILAVAAQRGDGALFDAWHAAARKESDARRRQQLLTAMGGFRDPEIVKRALALTLGDTFDIKESRTMIRAAAPALRPLVYEFVKTNFDALVDKLPRDAAASFPYYGTALCDESVGPDIEAFFKERSPRFTGGPRQLAQALESLRLCVAYRKLQRPNVERFFESYR